MLSAAQLRHFSEKGWVIRESVFTAAECAAMRAAGERQLRRLRDAEVAAGDTRDPELWGPSEDEEDGGSYGRVVVPMRGEPLFRELSRSPKMLPAMQQLLGTDDPQFEDDRGPLDARLFITAPHPRRSDPRMRTLLRDSAEFVWHRGIRPKWGIRAAEPAPDGRPLVTSWLNQCVMLSDALDSDAGGTAMLSASHLADTETADGLPPPVEAAWSGQKRNEGIANQVEDWAGLLQRREHICCPAGSVIHFSEATIHSGVAVLADQPRYALFFTATRDCDGRTDRRLGWRDPAVGPWGAPEGEAARL